MTRRPRQITWRLAKFPWIITTQQRGPNIDLGTVRPIMQFCGFAPCPGYRQWKQLYKSRRKKAGA